MTKPNFDEFLANNLDQANNPEHMPTPQKPLWSGVEKAINSEFQSQTDLANPSINGSRWRQLSAIAASTIIGMCAVYFSMQLPEQSPVVQMSTYFEQQKQTLLVQYSTQPALTTDWQVQLQELEQAEQAIKQALESDPDNAALLQMLAQVYQQQLDLINRVHQPRWQQI
ncbi:tetratricopeptide repeat protein [Pseudoalteromonas sp. SMS1]|uniref:tetratricopeptide repeat protein n=1 Tax=Pseudoalteromonas sp. SMS1 TaxID=2908894 RepID=UPI001F1E56A3|nr:tetratricopeptide repeat protein [Pseudoalteromonas sp. SMS1]MCF2859665.1 tetratricopeptide repeat protein [Pseudoalteromonas sp. SMS1]